MHTGLEWMETIVDNVPEEMKPYVDSFREGGKVPSVRDLLSLSIYDDERIELLPDGMKSLFNRYVGAKEEELEICSSPLTHPDDKGAARRESSQAFSAFSDALCGCLHISKQQQRKHGPLDFSEDGSRSESVKIKQ